MESEEKEDRVGEEDRTGKTKRKSVVWCEWIVWSLEISGGKYHTSNLQPYAMGR